MQIVHVQIYNPILNTTNGTLKTSSDFVQTLHSSCIKSPLTQLPQKAELERKLNVQKFLDIIVSYSADYRHQSLHGVVSTA